ncbi:MAG: PAS domain S-box protein [Deltaproteobacteria bacterium]|nr:MAG: PAS domain S-box protein [Deltaproteobacteria bacterium]
MEELKGARLKSESKRIGESIQIIRGKQAEMPLNAVIIGGGKACYDLLKILDEDRLSRLKMKILGVSDVNPEAPGFRYAKKLNLFTTTTLQELFTLEGLNLVIELTGSSRVREEVFRTKPSGVSLIDHRSARLLWDLIQMEMEKTELERERQRYEDKSKKHTQVILDSLPYRIMVVNMDLTINTVNQTFLREFNLAYKDVLGRPCYEVRYGLDKACDEMGNVCYIKDNLEEIKKKKLISTYKEYVDEGGESHFDVVTVAPIYDEKGEIVQILEASRDVTERIKLEREVQKSNTFFENVIQSTVDGIVVVDTKGNVLIFNEGMERLTGYPADEVMHRGHLSSFYDIEVAKENMRKMRSDQHGPVGKLNPTSMTITTKDGEEIPVTLSASIITIDGKEVGSVGVFTDMREILQMRKDLEDAHLQLVESERIASIGKMAAGVAHEINNPLSGILIYAELLRESIKGNAQHSNDVQEIIDQTLRCKRIVSELLEFSRQSVGKISSFSLKELIGKTLNLLINQAFFQNISVAKDIDREIPEMVGDMGQLQQVFTNLFINAADAMEGKGDLEIKARYDSDKNHFIIKVSDTGPGIPEALREKIFDIFFTTKPAGKGTGLGLTLSKNIIKLHGGNIMIESPPEGGTTFIIELPLGFVEQPGEEPLFVGLDE